MSRGATRCCLRERRTAAPGRLQMSENTITATDQTFEALIAGDTPGPCRLLGRVVRTLPHDWPYRRRDRRPVQREARVAKLNVDENPQTAGTYDVMSIPTLIVYKGGQAKKRIVGARPANAMLQELAEFIG